MKPFFEPAKRHRNDNTSAAVHNSAGRIARARIAGIFDLRMTPPMKTRYCKYSTKYVEGGDVCSNRCWIIQMLMV